MFGFGQSSNSLQASQQNSIINDMTFNFGDGNDRGSTDYGSQTQTPTQTMKDEFGLSASVGVGVGGAGSGGPASLQRQGDTEKENYQTASAKVSNFLSRFSTIEIIMMVFGAVAFFISFPFLKKRFK